MEVSHFWQAEGDERSRLRACGLQISVSVTGNFRNLTEFGVDARLRELDCRFGWV
jgi:hypothetical protein